MKDFGVVASVGCPVTEEVIALIISRAAGRRVCIRAKYLSNGPLAYTGVSEVETAVSMFMPTMPIHLGPHGKRAGFIRDRNLVRSVDSMLAFFSVVKIMSGGTAHVVEVCISEGVPVEAYVVPSEGHMWLLASYP